MPNPPAHHHSLLVAECQRNPDAADFADRLESFMRRLIRSIDMHVLIKPIIQLGPYGFTGIAGIVTSHIAFHYFHDAKVLQFDVYSCKRYDQQEMLRVLNAFWKIKRAELIFIDRECYPAKISRYTFSRGHLNSVD